LAGKWFDHRRSFAFAPSRGAILVAGVFLAILLRTTALPPAAADTTGPLEPGEALKHFRVTVGLTVELVACEPEVVDPVAMRFDEEGRLWVVEMRDYPHGPHEGEPPLSTIRVLTDEDGDGRYETSRLFAEHLLFPTGLQPWRGGVIVTLAGQVNYLKDTDGDGRADVQEPWFRGFATENPQLRANHPRFGYDNGVYIANGLRGGVIENLRQSGGKPLPISGMDFRCDPRSGAAAAVSGNGQFGLAFDDFGNRFVCNNREPLDHVVLENRYLARNPFFAVPAVLATVASAGEQSRVYPLTRAWTTSNLHAGQFTAACGVEIYRGDALGDAYHGNAFVCEPTGNLVHREILAPRGATFVSRPAQEGEEFLASDDDWFRPVNLEVGPDGALYIVDMYRAVIEHPQFMPSELQKRPDLRWGDDRGRIYRIVPAEGTRLRLRPRLSTAPPRELVHLLHHPNAWWRETAARLLYERQDQAAVELLQMAAKSGAEPTARGHALWALEGLGSLNAETLVAALSDAHPRVREQAVLLSESRLAVTELRAKLLALAADADPRVRFRVALALGGVSNAEVVGALAGIALTAPEDEWTRRAVATALPEHSIGLLMATIASPRLFGKPFHAPEVVLVRELATVVGSRREPAEMDRALSAVCRASDDFAGAGHAALMGLAEGVERRGGSLQDILIKLAPANPELPAALERVFARSISAAQDVGQDESVRAQHVDLLKFAPAAAAAEVLVRIVTQEPSQTLRIRAATALAARKEPTIGPALLADFASQTPAVRRAVLDALISQSPGAQKLLDELESGRIARVEIDATREGRLLHHGTPAVRTRAEKVLARAVPADRRAVLADYQPALQVASDPRAGKELFRKHCATCHRIGDVGVDVAPDISDSRVKTPAQLLTDILNPNQAIDNNYVSFTVATNDGQVHTGIVANESAASLTLRQPENKSLNLLRSDIATIRSNGVSLMPEGLEKYLSHQELADVIAFVKNWRYLDQPIPAQQPPVKK
jgi:putative membrane-bound dehydrogenase-like protein